MKAMISEPRGGKRARFARVCSDLRNRLDAGAHKVALVTLSLIGLLATVGGCASSASSSAQLGRVVEPEIGAPFADFTYVDAEGQPQMLAGQLGDFTILVFTKCGGDLHGPVARPLAELVRENQGPGVVKTVGFDIHWSEVGCTQSDGSHLLAPAPNLYSICDAKGVVRTFYGADDRNQVFVIGPDHRIVDRGSAGNWEALRARVHQRVDAYRQQKDAELPQEYAY